MPTINYFQYVITHLFSNLNFIKVYLDNILIISYLDKKDHLKKLSIVLNKLKDYNLKIKVSKWKFLQKHISYLDYKISNEGIFPERNKIEAIL